MKTKPTDDKKPADNDTLSGEADLECMSLLGESLSEAPALADIGPLRFVLQIDGKPRVLGVWTLKVQEGFPLDMSCHCAREKDYDIDWVEVIADACNRREFASLEKEVEILFESREGYLTKEEWEFAFILFAGGMKAHKTEQALYDHIWRKRPKLFQQNA